MTHITWISWIRVRQLDEALRILGIVSEISLLDAAGVEAVLPPAVEGDLRVNGVVDVANVKTLWGVKDANLNF